MARPCCRDPYSLRGEGRALNRNPLCRSRRRWHRDGELGHEACCAARATYESVDDRDRLSCRNVRMSRSCFRSKPGCNAGEISTLIGIAAPFIRSHSAIVKLPCRRSPNASNSGRIAGPRGRLGLLRAGRQIHACRRAASLSAALPLVTGPCIGVHSRCQAYSSS
jgi:hypothetical protein